MKAPISLSLLGVLFVLSFSSGQNLVAKLLKDKLPTPLFLTASYYDGESDSIYLVGGSNGTNYVASILRFDLTTEKIQLIGSLPKTSFGCPLEADSTGNLVYFECLRTPFEIYKYDLTNNSINSIGEMSIAPAYTSSAKNSAGRVLLFGGRMDYSITEIDVDSDVTESKVVDELPDRFYESVSTKVVDSTVLVFGEGGSVPYLSLDLETLKTQDVALNGFPEFQQGMTVTSDGKYAYLFGGDFTFGDLPQDGFIKLDMVTHSWELVQVEDFPADSEHYFAYAPEVVWVEKLNRIYMFGGALLGLIDFNLTFLDQIYYIDLNSTK